MDVWHVLSVRGWVVCFALLGAACGGSRPPPSALQEKLRAGCSTHGECSMLWAEARAREQECRQARRDDCSQAAIDLDAAQRLLAPYEELARKNLAREQAARDAERARLAEERRARELESARLQAERDEQQRLAAEAAAAERARRAKVREATYRTMSQAERARYLSDCFLVDAEVLHTAILDAEGPAAPRLSCDVLLMHLVATTESESEREALLGQLAERVHARKDPPPTPEPTPTRSTGSSGSTNARSRGSASTSGGSRALCCDGVASPSCGCGGGRGCCSHHGGVCGCTD